MRPWIGGRGSRRIFALSAILSIAAPALGGAADFAVVGMLNRGSLSSTGAATNVTRADNRFGAGLLIGFPLGKKSRSSLELGALFARRAFHLNATLIGFSVLEIPLVYRIWFSPKTRLFSLGLGLYYAQGFGDVSRTAAGSESSETFDAVGLSKADFGAVGVAGFGIPLTKRRSSRLVLEARYLYGLRNISTQSGISSYFDEIQGMVGIRFTPK